MERKPREKSSGLFADGLGFDIIYQGIAVTALIVTSYFIGHYIDTGTWEITTSPHGISMAFLTMCMVGCFHSINLRSRRQSIFKLKNQNWILILAVIISLLLTSIVCFVPGIASLFKLTQLGFTEWIIALALGFAIIPIVEIVKLIQRNLKKV